MLSREALVLLCVLASGAARAQQVDNTFSFRVEERAGALLCGDARMPDKPLTGQTALLVVALPAGVDVQAARFVSGATSQPLAVREPRTASQVSLEAKREGFPTAGTLVLTLKRGADVKDVTCDKKGDTFPVFASQPPAGSAGAGMNVLDGPARSFWLQPGKAQEQRSLLEAQFTTAGLKGPDRILIHLPSGQLLAPVEYEAAEGERLQVAFLLPADDPSLPSLAVDTCEDVESFRTKPSESGKKQGAGDAFTLVPVGPVLRCGGGKLVYRVTPVSTQAGVKQAKQAPAGEEKGTATEEGDKEGGGAEAAKGPNQFEFRVRPRYHLALSVMAGYDFAERTRYEKQTPPGVEGAVATVQPVRERVGIAAYVGAVWMVGGVDYGNMRWHNYFANVFVGVNPAAPTKDAIAGLALTPTGGVSIALGWGVHAGQRLKGGVSVGSPLTGEGDVPVEDSWSNVAHGPFVGVALDNNVFKALGDAFGSK